MQHPLIIFIVGTTAVGKTKLSLQLSRLFSGQILNCDSKQLYKHANIMTAKPTTQQLLKIPHHMIDRLQLNQNCYNRNKYYNEAIKVIDGIKARGKIPVVVGGTNYYLETLLYDIKMEDNDNEDIGGQGTQQQYSITNQQQQGKITSTHSQNQQYKQSIPEQQHSNQQNFLLHLKQSIPNMTNQQKYTELKKFDPIIAQKLHQNDQNRITTFLTRYAQTGNPPSLTYKPRTHKLRSNNTLLFWIKNQNKKQLHQLMKNRIDQMIEQGGLLQIISIFKYSDIYGLLDNMKMGVLQSIGYKQFHNVYQSIRSILTDPEFDTKPRQFSQIQQFIQNKINIIKQHLSSTTTLQHCKQLLLKNTIDYSKRQLVWLKNRVFNTPQNINNFFLLSLSPSPLTTEDLLQRFNLNIQQKSINIITQIQNHGIGSIQQNIKQFTINQYQGLNQWKKYNCEKCGVEVNGKHQWEEHLSSRKHLQNKTKRIKKDIIRKEKGIDKDKYKKNENYNKQEKRQYRQENINNIDQISNKQKQ